MTTDSEFKADMTKLLEAHNVKINRVTTKYKHTHSVCRVFNKVLAEKLLHDGDGYKRATNWRRQ